MKLQIVLQIPKIEDQNPEYTYILPDKIIEIDNGSCLSIELNNTLDYISKRAGFLEECFKKLRSKGIISISGLDIVELSKRIFNGKVTIDEINNILYMGKQSVDNLHRLFILLTNN